MTTIAQSGSFTHNTKMFRNVAVFVAIGACLAGCSGGGEYGTAVIGPTLNKLSLSPASIKGGTTKPVGTITLSTPAPAGGTTVNLSSTNSAVAQPDVSFVTVSQGATTGTFTITTTAVATDTVVTIESTLGATTKSANLTVTP